MNVKLITGNFYLLSTFQVLMPKVSKVRGLNSLKALRQECTKIVNENSFKSLQNVISLIQNNLKHIIGVTLYNSSTLLRCPGPGPALYTSRNTG